MKLLLVLILFLPTLVDSFEKYRRGRVRPDVDGFPRLFVQSNTTIGGNFELQGFSVLYEFAALNSTVVTLTPEELEQFRNEYPDANIELDVLRKPMHIVPSNLRGLPDHEIYTTIDDLEEHRRLQLEAFQSNLDQIQIQQAHEYSTGAGVKVCIIDSGVDIDHGDFNLNNFDGVENPALPWNVDKIGHGTAVTGIIAAASDSLTGVAPDADMFIVRAFGDSGEVFAYASGIVNAALACVSKNAKIINMALAGVDLSVTEQAVFSKLESEGILLIAAAGNSGEGAQIRYPAGYDSVVSVAAVDSVNERATFSQTNAAVDIAAPGVDILTTYLFSTYARFHGTSMACAHIAGVAALLWSYKPEATVQEIKDAMFNSASDLGFPGKDIYFGHGLVQALDALEYLNGGPLTSASMSNPTPPPTLTPTFAPIPIPSPGPSTGGPTNKFPTSTTLPVPPAPIVLNPVATWTQLGGAISGNSGGDRCGDTVAMNGNGSIIAVACPFDDRQTGLVRIYRQDSGIWTQLGQNIRGDDTSDLWGFSLAMSEDGTILAVGSPKPTISTIGRDTGRVKVYKFENSEWAQIGSTIDGDDSEECGFSVSLSLDGTVLAVGCPRSDGSLGFASGVARVYQLDNTDNQWMKVGEVEGELRSNNAGESVALNGDGTVLAIASEEYAAQAPIRADSGYIAVFRCTEDGEWVKMGSIIEGKGGGRFGTGLAISEDGTIVAGGADSAVTVNQKSGQVRIFQFRNNEAWVEIGSIDGENHGDDFGAWIDLSADGSVVAIGAVNNDDDTGTSRGHVQVYRYTTDTWEQVGQDVDGQETIESWGRSVKIARAGNFIVAGAPKADNGGTSSGDARMFELHT